MLIFYEMIRYSKGDLQSHFSCFLALLLVAAILWKIKQRYDRYRRRQRLFVEMEQMASRPFGSVLVELERLPENSASSSSTAAPVTSSSTNSSSVIVGGSGSSNVITSSSNSGGGGDDTTVVRKRKKRYRPSPIALEPCEGNRAAVLSLIVRLPTGGKLYAPPGYTGIAVASSLVTLGKLCKFVSKLFFKNPERSISLYRKVWRLC